MISLKNQDGYTLLELLVVISILMMSYMLVTPLVTGKRGSTKLNSMAQHIANDLRLLRSSAIMRGEVSHFKILENGHGYLLSTKEKPTQFGGDIQLGSASGNAFGNDVYFYPDGSNSGIDLRLSIGGNARKIISTWPMGKVEVQNDV